VAENTYSCVLVVGRVAYIVVCLVTLDNTVEISTIYATVDVVLEIGSTNVSVKFKKNI